MINRGDAVNLAHNLARSDIYWDVTPSGVKCLVDAVLAMDKYIRSHEANDAAMRWYQAASPYATPEALKEALKIADMTDSLRLELEAERSNHRRDNEYFIAERDRIRNEAERLLDQAYLMFNAQVVLPEDYEQWRKAYRAFMDAPL